MILLTGATGTTGQAIVSLLSQRSIPARAMVRDPAKGEALRAAGMDVVVADLTDPASLVAAVEGVDRAFLLGANSETQAAQEANFIDAAKAAGVQRIVKLSAIDADANSGARLKRFHGEAEAHLESSGLDYAIVRPAFYMQNMLHSAQTITAENKFYLPMGAGVVGTIDVRDVAEIVTDCLTADKPDNATLLITGPQALSFTQMADEFSSALGRKVDYIDVPPEDFGAQLLKWEPNTWYVDAVLELFGAVARNENPEITDTFVTRLGKRPRSFATFINDHRATFG